MKRDHRAISVSLLLHALFIFFGGTPAMTFASALELAPGLTAREFSCQVNQHELTFKELRMDRGHSLELRALDNPDAHPNVQCRDGYGGKDIEAVLQNEISSQRLPNFEIFGAVNGTVFRETPKTATKPAGYASNSLIWTQGAGLLAPWRKSGGGSIFVADSRGGHRFEIDPKKADKLLQQLQSRFPGMTLAIQSNMPLVDGQTSESAMSLHWSRCPGPESSDWRCRELARTLLCSRADGSISLMTTQQALPFDLAQGLRPGGSCKTHCELLYNLDGGRSTQIAWRKLPSKLKTQAFEINAGRIETSQEDCTPYRPVDNYLVVGIPKGKPSP